MHTKSRGVGHHVIAALSFVTLVLASMAFAAPPQSGIDAIQTQAQRTSFGKTTYRVVNLTDGEHYGDVAINASGQVAFSYTSDLFQVPIAAFFYDGSRIRNIGRLGTDYAVATSLNDAGQVVGQSRNAEDLDRTFIWSPWRPMTDIGILPGAIYPHQPVINNNGVVAGYMSGNLAIRSYRWSRSDGFTDLGHLAPSPPYVANALALNDAGVIVGSARVGTGRSHAFRWTFGSGMVDIDTLGVTDSVAIGIDASGNIVGNYYDQPAGNAMWRAFIWTPGSGMRPLVSSTYDVNAIGITPSGRVIGTLSSGRDYSRAFTWTRAGGIVELGQLGSPPSMPSGANNNGQVVGYAVDASGQLRAFVWSARLGMVDLNKRLRHAPPDLELYDALAIADNGAIVARANSGLVLLKPATGASCACPHTVGPIMARAVTLPGAPFDASVGIAGDRPAARYKVTWSWGDGATTVTGSAGVHSSARHTYGTPGVYTVSATVVDDSGASVRVSRKIAVQAAQGASGAGAFMAQSAAGNGAPQRAGRARFAFSALSADASHASRANRSGPGGPASGAALHFRVGDLDFRSADIAPVAAAPGQVRFAGSGAINGKGTHHFDLVTLAATGDAPARFGIKIWHTDAATGAQVIDYDNQQSDAGRMGAATAEAGLATASGAIGSALIEGSIDLP
ncbi:PKD domain-containing protein [Massilia sp. YIM B02443]|uniref:PKD domain-containing protein n=1 Tax=Massilia sp. YIM B02443 TaxID=3050127 RepID=UPI0025B6E9AE|nr:PKD domain-containing protein [Massilia sp. YIM B02443]MDN4039278.1 PKD domain-containing protein [Massilia sp. YIM B02443]